MEKRDYNSPIEELLKAYKVDSHEGLSTKEADKRLQNVGPNLFTKAKEKGLLDEIREILTQQLMVILLIAAGISIFIGEYYDAAGICLAILLSSTIGILTEGRSKKAAEALSRMTEDIEVKVLRAGNKILLHKSHIVPGDIVFVEAGDRVPADGRIIECMNLHVREDMLTGEAEDVLKHIGIVKEEEVLLEGKLIKHPPIPAKQFNMLFGGTLIAQGHGKMLVTATGDETEMGHIAKALGEKETETPLQLKMNKLAEMISKISTAIAALLFIYMFVQIVQASKVRLNFTDAAQFLQSLKPLVASFPAIKTAFIVCVALIVAAVPEGLPTMINITLAITMKQMAKINVLVRKKEACETIGSVSVICSDKTGTLTQNKMKVRKSYLEGDYIQAANLKNHETFLHNCMLNSTADLEYKEGEERYIGSATECALLDLCRDYHYLRARQNAQIIKQIPFSSESKWMLTIIKEENQFEILVKGAPEVIIKQCGYEKIGGQIIPLTPSRMRILLKEMEKWQKQSMRILAFAFQKETSASYVLNRTDWSGELVFEGFTAIQDPLREGVLEAVQVVSKAGIETKMLTGDNLQTAVAIGTELGLLKKGKIAVEASYIDTLKDEALKEQIKKIAVVARSKPDTKMRIVRVLQDLGEVVAVTGDGINDAPALTKADVGIAMGIAGTEVSKNAADIILTNDSFNTIVEAIKWGRGTYNNFQRFIQFQLTVNIIAFLIAIMSQLMGYAMPFTTIHLLWINMIMDGPPALALGLEPIRESVMNRMPIKRNKPIINGFMIRNIIVNSVLITGMLFMQIRYNLLGASQRQLGNGTEVQTVLFALFAFSVLFNAFNCREFGLGSIFPNLLKNRLALKIIALTAGLQFLMIQYGGRFFNALPLSYIMWFKIIGCSLLVIVINEGVKWIIRVGNKLFRN